MAELDVEAVDEISVDAPEYVLFGGKGGVGKTTMAAGTALASAEGGVETLVVSTDPAHSLSDAYETQIPAEPTRIRDDVPLYAAEIDPDAAMAEAPLFGDGGPLDGLGELAGVDPGDDLLGGDEGDPLGLGGTVPGADEAAAMQQLLRYLDDDRFERVVIDTAPTGHTLRLLELPEMMDSMVGRVLTIRERLQGLMDNVTGLFGGADDGSERDVDDLEALRERIERLRETLTDPERTDFRIVMVPEGMSVVESKRLRSRLESFEIPVGTVVVNRVMEDLTDVTDIDADLVSPNLESCAFCQRRWKVQQSALTEAQDFFRGHDIQRVPLFADEVRGDRMLRVVAACLSG